MKCMKSLITLLTSLSLLSACATVEFDEIASAGAGIAGCAVGSALAGPVGCAAGGGSAASATIVITEKSQDDIDITKVETPEQAEVAKSQIFWNFVQNFTHWLVGGVVVLIGLAWVLPGPQSIFRRRE